MTFISRTLRAFQKRQLLSSSSSSSAFTGSACNSRSYSSTPIQCNALKDVVNRYSISGQQHRIKVADRFYRAAQWQALAPQWYASPTSTSTSTSPASKGEPELLESVSGHGISADFRPTHAMLSMHVWFIHRRLLSHNTQEDKDSGKHGYNLMIQEELFDVFWNDTKARIRSSGVNELTVHKHLKDAQQATFLHCTQYDHAYDEFGDDGDEVKRFEVICDGVWKHVLGGGDDVNEELIRKLGAYVEYQLENIVYKLPDDYFDEGRIAWGDIPGVSQLNWGSYKGVLNNDSDKGESDHGESGENPNGGSDEEMTTTNALCGLKTLGNNWMQVLTDAGEPYYWNTETNSTSWQRPSQ